MARAGVFYIEQAPIVSVYYSKNKDVALLDVTTVNNGNSMDSLFATAWRDDTLDDTDEYEVTTVNNGNSKDSLFATA